MVRSLVVVMVLSVVVVVGGCVQSSAVDCGDSVCPAGTRCVAPDICQPLTCHDGTLDPFEACDSDADVTGDCTDYGFYVPGVAGQPGGLTCGLTCQPDTSRCEQRCGDHVANGPEACDGLPPSGESCLDYGRDLGPLGCVSGCATDLRSCGTIGWQAGRGGAPVKLLAIGGSDLDHLFAVGQGGTIVQRVQGEWAPLTSPTAADLRGAWARSPTEAYAVGSGGTILAFDGARWTPMSSPATQDLNGVSGTTTEAIAVGDDGTILELVNGAWIAATVSSGSANPIGDFYAVSAEGEVAVGSTGVVYQRADDGVWRPAVGAPSGAILLAVTGRGGRVIAVGANGRVLTSGGAPGAWADTTLPPLTPGGAAPLLTSVWISATGETYLGAADGAVLQYLPQPAGAPILVDTQLEVNRGVTAVFGLDPQRVFATSGSSVYEFDGTFRRTEAITSAAGLPNVRAVAHLGPDDVLAGDSSGAVFQRVGGGAWSPLGGGLQGAITSLWHSDGVIGLAAHQPASPSVPAYDRLLFATSVASLEAALGGGAQGPAVPKGINAIGGVKGDVYVVGDAIHHATDPTLPMTWVTEVAPATGARYTGVWSPGGGVAVAVGDSGRIQRRALDGTWTLDTPEGIDANFGGVWGTAPDNVYVVGSAGRLLRFDGVGWRRIPLGTGEGLAAVHGSSASDVFVVGVNGTAFHFDGTSWSRVNTGTSRSHLTVEVTPTSVLLGSTQGFGDELVRIGSDAERRCGDAWDDDGDGLVNCADPQCANAPECAQGGACALAQPLTCGATLAASTFTGVAKLDDLTCLPVSTRGPEAVYRFTAERSGDYRVAMAPGSAALELAVAPAYATSAACDVTACTGGSEVATGREVTFSATAGDTYYVIVDSPFGAGADFTLEVTCP